MLLNCKYSDYSLPLRITANVCQGGTLYPLFFLKL